MKNKSSRSKTVVERHSITLLREHVEKLRRVNPNLSHAIRHVLQQETIKFLWCEHGRLELRSHEPPSESRDLFWCTESYLICLDCSTRLMYVPNDLTAILNIPHPPKDECDHPSKNCTYGLAGGRTCLQCGDRRIETPSHKLEIFGSGNNSVSNTVLGDVSPSAQLHIHGDIDVGSPTYPTRYIYAETDGVGVRRLQNNSIGIGSDVQPPKKLKLDVMKIARDVKRRIKEKNVN